MGNRTGKEPSAEDTFLWRILHALDEHPYELAKNIGVRHKDIKAMLGDRQTLADIDRDETWWLISEYVNRKLGSLLAVKAELNKALQSDRARRALRVNAVKQRDKKSLER